MKIQFSAKSGNQQISDDDSTLQIQIGPWYLVGMVVVVALIISLVVMASV